VGTSQVVFQTHRNFARQNKKDFLASVQVFLSRLRLWGDGTREGTMRIAAVATMAVLAEMLAHARETVQSEKLRLSVCTEGLADFRIAAPPQDPETPSQVQIRERPTQTD
jgi:hypothetical protein